MHNICHLTIYSLLIFNTLKPMIVENESYHWNPYCLQSMPEEILCDIALSTTDFSQKDLRAAPYYQKCINFSKQYSSTNITLTPKGNSLVIAYPKIIKTLSLINKELHTTLNSLRSTLSSKQELNGNPLLNLRYFKHFCIIRRAEQNENESECEFSSAIRRCSETGKPFFKIYSVFLYNVNKEHALKLPFAMQSIHRKDSLDHVRHLLSTLKAEALTNNNKFDAIKYIDLLNYFNKITYSEGGYGPVNPFQAASNAECRIINKDDLEKDEYKLPYKVIENFINI